METEIFTMKHLEAGMSRNGGWSNAQLDLLNVNHKVKGWRFRAVGNRYPKSVIERFIALKDAHLPIQPTDTKESAKKPSNTTDVTQCYVAKGRPSAEIRAECPFDLPPDSAYDKALRKKREKDYRSADWKSEQDRMMHFDYLTEGI